MIYWALLGAVLASYIEYLYRVLPGPWFQYLWLWIPGQTIIGYCVYKMVTVPNTSLLAAFVVWTFATMCMRIFVSTVALHDTITPGTWAALGLIVLAKVVQHVWR